MNYTAAELLEFATMRETWAIDARRNDLGASAKEWEKTAAIARQCVRLDDALRAALLFHDGGDWTDERRAEWKRITGSDEATTKVLCDHIRSVRP